MVERPSIAVEQKQLVEEFALFDDWNDRYEHIISLGRALPDYPDDLRTENREVQGCQSRVWLDARFENGIVYFKTDSDALITKGLAALMVNLFSGRTPDEILSADLEFLKEIGLEEHLTPSRVNGLLAMFKAIREHAARFKSFEEVSI